MSNTVIRHIKTLAEFAGREKRGEFWPFAGLVVAAFMILMMFIEMAFIFTADGPPRMDLMFVWVGVLMIPIVGVLSAAVARRLHDSGLSATWGLLPLPFLAFAFFAMYRASGTEFNVEADSTFNTAFASGMLYDISLIVLIVLLARRSDEGANRFGAAPDFQ